MGRICGFLRSRLLPMMGRILFFVCGSDWAIVRRGGEPQATDAEGGQPPEACVVGRCTDIDWGAPRSTLAASQKAYMLGRQMKCSHSGIPEKGRSSDTTPMFRQIDTDEGCEQSGIVQLHPVWYLCSILALHTDAPRACALPSPPPSSLRASSDGSNPATPFSRARNMH